MTAGKSAIRTLLRVVSAIAVPIAVAGIFLAYLSADAARDAASSAEIQAEASEEQVKASQAQVQAARLQLRVQNRPYLNIGKEPLRALRYGPTATRLSMPRNVRVHVHFGRNYVFAGVQIRNTGPGFALVEAWRAEPLQLAQKPGTDCPRKTEARSLLERS